MIAAATVKINKMADVGFPRSEGKQGEFLLMFSINDCIIKYITTPIWSYRADMPGKATVAM